MAHEFVYTRRVQFVETDAAGMAHFTTLFRYMEEAEHAFYRSLGSSAHRWTADRLEGMPRVSVSCDFHSPLLYAEEVEIRLTVREKTAKAIRYEVAFFKKAGEDRLEVARGSMKVVNAARPHGSLEWAAADLPSELRDEIQVAPQASGETMDPEAPPGIRP